MVKLLPRRWPADPSFGLVVERNQAVALIDFQMSSTATLSARMELNVETQGTASLLGSFKIFLNSL